MLEAVELKPRSVLRASTEARVRFRVYGLQGLSSSEDSLYLKSRLDPILIKLVKQHRRIGLRV